MIASPGEFEVLLAMSGWLGQGASLWRGAEAPPTDASGATASVVQLPSGRALDLERSRWDGPLDAEELAYCRAHGVELCYDCAQVGWVTQSCSDDPVASATSYASIETPPDVVAARRATAGLRRRARRLAQEGGGRDAASRSALTAALADEVRAFREPHGLRAASALHWALHSTVRRELAVEPDPAAPERDFTFRPWTAGDAPEYRRMLDNPRMWEFMPEPLPMPLTEAAARTLIELGSIEGVQEALAVVHGGRPVGQCLLRFDEPFAGARAAELAYWLDEQHWGKGWMTRILPAFLARSAREHRVDVVYAWIREDHAASRRVAERAGLERDDFVFEREWAGATRRAGFVRYATYPQRRPRGRGAPRT